MIRLDRDTCINPLAVSSTRWDRTFYANGRSSSFIVTMVDGTVYRLAYPSAFGDPDPYEVEKAIQAAIAERY